MMSPVGEDSLPDPLFSVPGSVQDMIAAKKPNCAKKCRIFIGKSFALQKYKKHI
jgi:hypothetical protein